MCSAGRNQSAGVALREKVLLGAVLVLQGYAVWARGGTYTAWQGPLLWLACAVVLVWIAWPDPELSSLRRLLGLVKDPLFYLFAAFCIFLVLQWDNSGRIRIFDPVYWGWRYTDPPRPGWPSAVTRAEAMEMLRWFVPAGVLVLVIRHGLHTVLSRRLLVFAVALGGGLNAAWGLVQFGGRFTHMYGVHEMPGYFFASFGYPNHAGSYYMLCLGAALGGAAASFRERGRENGGSLYLWTGVALLLVVAANFTLSRAGIVGSWLLLLVGCMLFFSRAWSRTSPAQRFNLSLAVVLTLAASYLVVSSLGSEMLQAEIEKIRTRTPGEDFDARWFQVNAAVEMFREHPWFGVGGWGYRYFLPMYVDPELWDKIGVGKANVHNDPVQFLAEFGLTGSLLLAACLGIVVFSNYRYMKEAYGDPAHYLLRPMCLLPMAGLLLVAGQSLVDLPFRSPAVLYTWLILLACLAPAADDPVGYSLDTDY